MLTAAAGVITLDVAEVDWPIAFVATTVNVYAVPLVRPVIWHEVVEVVQLKPPVVVTV